MDSDPPYRPGSQGCLLGGIVGLIVSLPICFPILFIWAWSGAHCEPVPACQRAVELQVGLMLAVVALFAAVIALAVRALYNWSQLRSLDPASVGRPPLWAILVLIMAALVAATAFSIMN